MGSEDCLRRRTLLKNPPVDEPEGMLFQRYTLLSTDLGKTWATACAASPRDERMADDGGKSWNNHQAFAQLSKQAEQIVMGGNRESLHVAIFRGTELGSKEKGCLIIRSFVNGTWTAPTQPAPSWFKAEKVPELHKEDF